MEESFEKENVVRMRDKERDVSLSELLGAIGDIISLLVDIGYYCGWVFIVISLIAIIAKGR